MTGFEWRPIDDEAKSGEVVHLTDGISVYAGYWGILPRTTGGTKRHPWVFLDPTNGTNGWEEDAPTHWMPFPPPSGATK